MPKRRKLRYRARNNFFRHGLRTRTIPKTKRTKFSTLTTSPEVNSFWLGLSSKMRVVRVKDNGYDKKSQKRASTVKFSLLRE